MNLKSIQLLDPLTVPLEGINLIEASAGTGKTYTIAILFIRLLLEKQLSVDTILVVTFTQAATEELRARIRQRLLETLAAFEAGCSDEVILAGLLHHYPQRQQAIFRLTQALRDFDEASILTIHGFCLKMLHENAFESGVLFDTELIADQRPLLQEIVEDFWRQHFYSASILFIDYVAHQGYRQPTHLLNLLGQGRYVGQPFLHIIPQCALPDTQAFEDVYQQAFSQAQHSWWAAQEEIQALLIQNSALNGQKYRQKSMPQWFEALADCFNARLPTVQLPESLAKLTQSALNQGVKKGHRPPEHIFFQHCEHLLACQQQLSAQFQIRLLALKYQLFQVAQQALSQKKYQQHIQFFDDLLIQLYNALSGVQGQKLAALIRKHYKAALIDEFQDTDPVQYQIFHSVYRGDPEPLFLIGDPKQAIYSFRGADIFTYMAAYQQAHQRYTLATNWRAEAELIAATNQIFNHHQRPFLFEQLAFYPVAAPQQPKPNLLSFNAQHLPPLQLWFVSRQQAQTDADKPISKSWAQQHIPLAVSYEIARLLQLGQQGTALIGDKPIQPGDIAILVRTHIQARLMQKILIQQHIPSVLYTQENLFHTHEALEIENILTAVATPQEERLIKVALTTELLGYSADALYELRADERRWYACVRRFQKYHWLWEQVSFMQMYRSLLTTEQVQARLLSYADGERRLTNVLHLGELLQQTALQAKMNMRRLMHWLAQQRQQETVNEEQQLRLESDEQRLKIVTIHKSKGLEYPIVFCPFLWDGYLYTQKDKQFTFHNEYHELILDLGSNEQAQHRQQALLEERAEQLRLCYVALTRAKHRCYLIWGAFRDAATSALAHLLHPQLAIDQIDDVTLEQALTAFAQHHALQVTPLPLTPYHYQRPTLDAALLTARSFAGEIDDRWQVTSFTALISKRVEAVEQPDYDELSRIRTPFTRSLSLNSHQPIFNFPSGARAGAFMHTVFEQIDFTQVEPAVIQQYLQAYGYDTEHWQAVIETLVRHVLTTPLHLQQPALTLAQISRENRLNELEFYYPLTTTITAAELQDLFAHYELPVPLNFPPLRGVMKGFIDMVFHHEGRFYLVDYKSNLLGNQMQNYHHNALNTVMMQEGYYLQYHLYTVALHRYLAMRLPYYRYEDHFGGVFYLFVRGMQPYWGAHFGIYRDTPPLQLIQALSNYFAPETTPLPRASIWI